MNAIEVKDLKFKYLKSSENYTLDGVTLSIPKGEYVTIIGHNGSGKSTLAKLIIGLLQANEGEIKVFDQVLNEETVRDIRSKVGIIFQNPDNQFIGATVRDDIAFGLENHCVEHDKMDEIIQEYSIKVNMNEFLDKEPSALSGGQKQRVAIAGVLAMHPDVILMDEATAMLDPRGKGEIVELTHKLKAQNPNLTIVSITHDIEEAYSSDRCIVLNKGKVMFNDIPSEVFKHEQELISIGLDIPFLQKMNILLKEKCIDLGNPNSLDEMKEKLCR